MQGLQIDAAFLSVACAGKQQSAGKHSAADKKALRNLVKKVMELLNGQGRLV